VILKYALIGCTLAFTAAIQPGPTQAYLLSRVASIGWRRTLPAALFPLISDGPIALIALLILGQLPVAMQSGLRLAGGLLLLYFASRSFIQWLHPEPTSTERHDKAPRTILEAAIVNLLNPNPYIGWTLILGPIVVAAWNEAPGSGVAVVGAFYITMIVTLALLIYGFGTARLLGPRFQRWLQLLSGILLAILGVYQGYIGVRHLIAYPTDSLFR